MDQHVHHTGTTISNEGVSFCVWAPFASEVAVTGDFTEWSNDGLPLARDNNGYWHATVAQAKAGEEYKFVITNGQQVLRKNDARALQLTPSGANSIIVDPRFDWQDNDFTAPPIHEQVIYELHIGTFHRHDPATPGTFDAAIEKLDYLAELGVTTIELMPCSETSIDRWWGYTPNFLYAIEAAYGGRHAFMRFVQAAHQRGLAVILDVVYNHIHPDPAPDLWQYDGWSEHGRGGIYFYNDWRAKTPWGDTRLDYGRPEVRQYITDNVRMWLRDCHVDGLRVDSTHYIRNALGRSNDASTDIPEGWQLLQEITNTARSAQPQVLLIAEDTASNDWITKSTEQSGAGFNAQWETPLPYILRDAVLEPLDDAGRNIDALVAAITKTYNGDPFQRVIYSESHDADANGRARLNEEISPGHADSLFARRRSVLAAALVLTLPGIPMLFQGQEFMEDGSFTHWDMLDWSKADQFHGTLQLYKDLIALRRNTRGNTVGLMGPALNILHVDNTTKLLAYQRDNVVVVANFANAAKRDYRIKFPGTGTWRAVFNSDWRGYSNDFSDTPTPDVLAAEDGGVVQMGPYSVVIFVQI